MAIELILIGIIVFLVIMVWFMYKIGIQKGRNEKEIEWQSNLIKLRKDIADKQRVNIKGRVAEIFAPFLEGFPYKASESKFIGDPIDYLVFEGLEERNIRGVHLVEIKTDKSQLNKVQRQIKEIIENNANDKISFKTFEFKTTI
ncbi:MAG: Holliday junction resolvase-like protein [Candidatus Pacearchaeota archaeon]